LIDAIRSSLTDVQMWISLAEDTFPIVFDRGANLSLGLDAFHDLQDSRPFGEGPTPPASR